MNIPTRAKKEDFKIREEIITSFYVEWGRNNFVGKPLPIKPGSKNQKNFSKMIRLECQLNGIGKVKLLVGIKKKTGELVQYCITVLE